MLELHPDPPRLRAFGMGRLGAIDSASIEDHILQCEQCCDKLRLMSSDGDSLLGLAREAIHTPPPVETTDSRIPKELLSHPRYRIIEELGEGGMGTVFKAHHKLMDRTVALKVIQRKFVENPYAVERFRNEVRMAAKLHHPNIVASYDAEEVEGLHFLVMEYVDGISLDRFAAKQKGPIPYPLACHIIRQAAVGLQHAHTQGLVHRDIKPHNIMVTRRGQVKLLDFGLTRLSALSGENSGFTKENLVVGTPDFIAPEQARNARDVDIRTDIYALGCTFYYLLTRRVPFPGMTSFEKMVAHTEIDPTPVMQFRKDFPPELDAVLKKMMAKRRDERYAAPSEVVAALGPWAKLAAPGASVPPSPSAEPEAEGATEKIDTSELNDSNTHRLPQVTRLVRPARLPRRRRKRKELPTGLWIAGAIIGTAFLFALIFLAALRNRPEHDIPRADGQSVVKGEEKQFNVTTPNHHEKEGSSAPRERDRDRDEDGFKKSMLIEPREPFGKVKSGFPSKGFGPKPEGQPLRGKSVLLLVPSHGADFAGIDATRDALKDRGVSVSVISTTDDRPCTGLDGIKRSQDREYRARIELGKFNPEFLKSSSAVICCGGEIDEFLTGKTRQSVERLLNALPRDRCLFGAVGTGEALLARTGHLDGREVAKVLLAPAKYDLTPEKLPKVNWSDKKVVRSGNVITASGPEAAHEFADEVVKALLEK